MMHPASIQIMGEGPPLLLIASPFVLSHTYRSTAQELARDFRVYRVELPGCGRGGQVARPRSFLACAAWVAGLLEGLGLEDVTLVGHSNSGAVVVLAAALWPERVGRVILADAVGGDARPSLVRTLIGRAMDAVTEWTLTLWGWPQLAINAWAHFANFFYHVYLAGRSDLRGMAGLIDRPTLVAWGGRDRTTPLRCGRAYVRAISSAKWYVSQRGSHDWIVDHAAEFAAMTRRWVGEKAAPRVTCGV